MPKANPSAAERAHYERIGYLLGLDDWFHRVELLEWKINEQDLELSELRARNAQPESPR